MSVKLNVANLEGYLLQIKEQLSRHEDELVHPVWWNSLVRQIDQISSLNKRLEHQNGDINALRELVLQSEQTKGSGGTSGSFDMGGGPVGMSAVDKAKSRALHQQVGILQADVETLKLMVRKIDLTSATESLMMSQIRELQRYLRGTTRLLDERAPDGAYLTLKQVVQTVETIIPDLDRRLSDSEESLREFVEARVPVVSDEVSLRVYREERSKEIECVPRKEYLSKVASISKMIEGVNQKIESMNVNAALKSTIQGKKSLNDAVRRRLKQRERDLFDRWIKYTAYMRQKEKMDRLKDFNTFWPRFKKYVEALANKTYFEKWKARVERLRIWDLYKHRLKKSILMWRNSACPDLRKYLLRWRATVVTMRIPEFNIPLLLETQDEEEASIEEKMEKELNVEETQEMIEIIQELEDATREGNRAAKAIQISQRGRSPSRDPIRRVSSGSLSPSSPNRLLSNPSSPQISYTAGRANRSQSALSGKDAVTSSTQLQRSSSPSSTFAKLPMILPANTPGTISQESPSASPMRKPVTGRLPRKHTKKFREVHQARQRVSATGNKSEGISAAKLLNTYEDRVEDLLDPESLEYLAELSVAHLDDIPAEHLDQKVGLLGQFVRHSSRHIDTSLVEVEELRESIGGFQDLIERKANEARLWTDSQCGAVANNLQKWSNRVTLNVRDVTQGLADFKHQTNDMFDQLEERIEKLVRGLNDQRRTTKEIQESIDGIKLLQGDVLEKTSKLEDRMSSLEKSYGDCIANSNAAITKAKYAEELVEKSEKRLTEGLEFFDSEFSASKKAAKTTNRFLNQTAATLETFQMEVRATEKKLLDRTDEIEDLVRRTYQGVALPDELAELCFRLEDQVMNEPGASVADLFRDEKYNQMLSSFCLRLARQIHDTAHSRMMERIIAGERIRPSLSPSKTTLGTGAKIGSDLFANDDTAIEKEQKILLEKFSEEFVKLLRERESRPGYVRAQTRVVLHSRFTAALEMALGEMNSRDKKPYMNTIPSEFLNGMNIATSAWGEDAQMTFPSPTKFESTLLPDPTSPVSNYDERETEAEHRGLSGTVGILGPRSRSAPGIIHTGEDLSKLYPREASIPSLGRAPTNMSDASTGDAFASRKLIASGKLDAFGATKILGKQ